jgi:hypothetical protein
MMSIHIFLFYNFTILGDLVKRKQINTPQDVVKLKSIHCLEFYLANLC